MNTEVVIVDLSSAKTALCVRQILASGFGIPLGREFTWDSLTTQICEATLASAPKRLLVRGLPKLQTTHPEAKSLTELLRVLQSWLPRLTVLFTLHD